MQPSNLSEQLRRQRVIVTGAGGFIGRHVLAFGQAHGVELHTLDPVAISVPGVHATVGSVLDPESLRALLEEVRPSGILHLAAAGVAYGSSALDELISVNVLGLGRLLAAATALADPPAVVCAGSGFEYAPKHGLLRETDAVAPPTAYGVSKAAATLVAQHYADRLSLTVLRIFSVYGPGEPANRVAPYVISRIRAGRPVDLTPGEQLRDYCFVGDIAEGFWRALAAAATRGKPRVMNLASGHCVTLRAFVNQLAAIVEREGYSADLRYGARPYRPDELMDYTADVALLRAELGWTPATPLAVGLQKTVEQHV